MRTRSRRPLQRCRIQKLQRPPNGDSFPAARSAAGSSSCPYAISYPRQIVAANWARGAGLGPSARCCVAKGSTHRNWLPGVSSASPSNARCSNQRSAGAKPTPSSKKRGRWRNSPRRMIVCVINSPKRTSLSTSKKNFVPYSACQRPRTGASIPDGRAQRLGSSDRARPRLRNIVASVQMLPPAD